jgi:predicted DNA-binding protein YlxM (UPF0122 family)
MTSRKIYPTEHEEQAMLFEWSEWMSAKYPYLRMMYAIPNGGLRAKKTAVSLKAEGVKAGVPDIFFPYPEGGFHGLFIEMKRQKGGILSVEQREYMEHLAEVGYCVVVCEGFEEGKQIIEDYINDRTSNIIKHMERKDKCFDTYAMRMSMVRNAEKRVWK